MTRIRIATAVLLLGIAGFIAPSTSAGQDVRARDLGIPFVEEDIQTYDAINADEAWLPSTPYCLAPVTRINGEAIGDGQPGSVWRRMLDRWSEVAGKDIYQEMTGESQA